MLISNHVSLYWNKESSLKWIVAVHTVHFLGKLVKQSISLINFIMQLFGWNLSLLTPTSIIFIWV